MMPMYVVRPSLCLCHRFMSFAFVFILTSTFTYNVPSPLAHREARRKPYGRALSPPIPLVFLATLTRLIKCILPH